MIEKRRELVVAAIQIESIHGEIEINLEKAVKYVTQASKKNAKLVILPELFSCGYIPNPNIWNYGESNQSMTINWARNLSKELNIYLGVGLVEIIEKEYLNTFIITNPEGNIEGRIQKDNAESYCFKRGKGLHIIESNIGKIGVGICADNHYTKFVKMMQEEKIDILLMPHAWPSPVKASKGVSTNDIKKTEEEIKQFPIMVANLLGIPSIFINQIGEIAPMAGILGKIMDPEIFKLKGYSRIIDLDGKVKSELNDEAGIAIAKVIIDPALKKKLEMPSFNGWLQPGSKTIRKIIIPLDIFFGSLYYKMSKKRKKIMSKIMNI